MIVKYRNYSNNKSSSGYEVLIDNVKRTHIVQINRPVDIEDSTTQRFWDTIEYFMNNPELTTIEELSTEDKKYLTAGNLLSHGNLNRELLHMGLEGIDSLEFKNIRKIDNIDYRFLKETCETGALNINCITLIKDDEIITILTNTITFVMNDEGKTIQVIK